jgi:hypothetical protein
MRRPPPSAISVSVSPGLAASAKRWLPAAPTRSRKRWPGASAPLSTLWPVAVCSPRPTFTTSTTSPGAAASAAGAKPCSLTYTVCATAPASVGISAISCASAPLVAAISHER